MRYYAAYRLDDPDFYDLAMATYIVAMFHFGTELLWYKTTRVLSGSLSTYVVGVATLVWMGVQRGAYVGR